MHYPNDVRPIHVDLRASGADRIGIEDQGQVVPTKSSGGVLAVRPTRIRRWMTLKKASSPWSANATYLK